MTSGAGVARAEQTPRDNTGRLNGVQLCTALPDRHRHVAPAFAHLDEVPAVEWPSGIVQILAGELAGARSPAPHYSPLVGADLREHPRHELMVPIEPAYEHSILVMGGDCALGR